MSRVYFRLFSLATIWLLLNAAGFAQFALRSGIQGIVTDESGAVVQDAGVTLKDLDRNQTYHTKTNSEGLYAFTNLTFGRYQVTVERAGFSKAVSGEINLASQGTQRVDIPLKAGELAATVSVTAPQGDRRSRRKDLVHAQSVRRQPRRADPDTEVIEPARQAVFLREL